MLSDGRPSKEGEVLEVENHSLVAEEGNIPFNDLVWECAKCGVRGADAEVFQDRDCKSD